VQQKTYSVPFINAVNKLRSQFQTSLFCHQLFLPTEFHQRYALECRTARNPEKNPLPDAACLFSISTFREFPKRGSSPPLLNFRKRLERSDAVERFERLERVAVLDNVWNEPMERAAGLLLNRR
jgi:hypothetical protein